MWSCICFYMIINCFRKYILPVDFFFELAWGDCVYWVICSSKHETLIYIKNQHFRTFLKPRSKYPWFGFRSFFRFFLKFTLEVLFMFIYSIWDYLGLSFAKKYECRNLTWSCLITPFRVLYNWERKTGRKIVNGTNEAKAFAQLLLAAHFLTHLGVYILYTNWWFSLHIKVDKNY